MKFFTHTALLVFVTFFLKVEVVSSQKINPDTWGAWYIYFFDGNVAGKNWGIQGDIQHRTWNGFDDMEQFLARGGFYYKAPKSKAQFTLGYATITTGEFGSGKKTSHENRIYQEFLFPENPLPRVFLTHRIRIEQRWVDNQKFRTRYRYFIAVTVPLNKPDLSKGAIYIQGTNAVFINGEKNIGNGKKVELFDRDRIYGAFGYSISNNLKIQVGAMRQITDTWAKNQVQISLHHKFQLGKEASGD
jgi:hypothetical protein